MAIISNSKNANFVLHFYDDESFIHRQLETMDKFLIEKVNDKITRAWALLFKLRFRFDGVKGISAGMYTITHNNDTVYDPFNQVGKAFTNGKGKEILRKGGGAVQELIKTTKENTFNKHLKSKKNNPHFDKAFWLIGGVIVVLGIAIFIVAVT